MQGLFLLRPSRDLNEIVNGVLARAVARYKVAICASVVLSNHMHLLLVPGALSWDRVMSWRSGSEGARSDAP